MQKLQTLIGIIARCIVIALCSATVQSQAQVDDFNKYYQEILTNYVSNGVVDYSGLAKNTQVRQQTRKTLQAIELATLKGNEKKALLINTYNFLVLDAVAEKFSVTSVLKINGFFDQRPHKIGEKSYTLNQLEKEVLFKEFPDPQLHFVLVCGAVSCPPLGSNLITGNNLESELKNITHRALNSKQLVSINLKEKTVTISKLFEWYLADFAAAGGAIDFINTYRRTDTIPDGLTLQYAAYNWDLNGR